MLPAIHFQRVKIEENRGIVWSECIIIFKSLNNNNSQIQFKKHFVLESSFTSAPPNSAFYHGPTILTWLSPFGFWKLQEPAGWTLKKHWCFDQKPPWTVGRIWAFAKKQCHKEVRFFDKSHQEVTNSQTIVAILQFPVVVCYNGIKETISSAWLNMRLKTEQSFVIKYPVQRIN